jgi:hypothetical protein
MLAPRASPDRDQPTSGVYYADVLCLGGFLVWTCNTFADQSAVDTLSRAIMPIATAEE